MSQTTFIIVVLAMKTVCCKSKMENIADLIWRKMQELGSLSHCLSM